ncbi:MAG: hypothetical protein ABI418_20365 [Jatrophihabitantaceae bacterium]
MLAILADAAFPMSNKQLAAAHFSYACYVNWHLNVLQRAGTVVRRHPAEPASTWPTYWWLPDRPSGVCAVCGVAGAGFVPPLLDVEEIRGPAWSGGPDQLLWREITERPGTGGWVCAAREHAIAVMRQTRRAAAAPAPLRDPPGIGAGPTVDVEVPVTWKARPA